jgi:hypothetical protein
MKVQDRRDTEQACHTKQDEFPKGAATERHMNMCHIDLTSRAGDGDSYYAGHEAQRHLPEGAWPVGVDRTDLYVARSERGEKVTSHAAHAPAPLDPARCDVDDPYNIVIARPHKHTAWLTLKCSANIVISHRLRCWACITAHILTISNRSWSKRNMIGGRSGYHFVGKPWFVTTGMARGV